MHFKELLSMSQGNKLASSRIPFPVTDVWKVLRTSRRKSSWGDFSLIPSLGASSGEAAAGRRRGLLSRGWFSLSSRARGAAHAGIPAATGVGHLEEQAHDEEGLEGEHLVPPGMKDAANPGFPSPKGCAAGEASLTQQGEVMDTKLNPKVNLE